MENRVVVDTNVMVSFLIGRRLQKLKNKLSDLSIKLILTDQLINDNFLLSLCVSGNAAYLVTGDKDLLDLMEYKGTKIIRATEFEKLL